MKISFEWLQSFFDKPLPSPEAVARLLTMHAYEVEWVEKYHDDTIFEIDILPNRAHDSLSHRGVARELAVLAKLPIKEIISSLPAEIENVRKLSVTIEDEKLCRRYVGRVIENIAVGRSPEWLVRRLESIGQRTINNVVDATNYAMFTLGQPLHAFDADRPDSCGIIVRHARAGEAMKTLDGQEIRFTEDMLVIADTASPLALAGVKGGTQAEVTEGTKNIILEAANFEPKNVRKTSQAVGIRTDSSMRFERELAPWLASEAMEYVTALISDTAGTEETKIGITIDAYPRPQAPYLVGVSTEEVNMVLGTTLSDLDIASAFDRLGFPYEKKNPVAHVLSIARGLEGKPYLWGASVAYDAPKRFDCSSFTAYLFAQAGVNIPRMTVDQYVYGQQVSENDIKAGDLIFANTGIMKRGIHMETKEYLPGTQVPEGVDHVGLSLGGGQVMHATEKEGKVVIEPLAQSSGFQNIVGVRRYEVPERFVVSVPAERLDVRLPVDLVEEIGRIVGYDTVPVREPRSDMPSPVPQEVLFRDAVRDALADIGFSEILTSSFTAEGDPKKHRLLENPISEDKKYLRHALAPAFSDVLAKGAYYKDLLGIGAVQIFEIGKVFDKDGEYFVLAIGVKRLAKDKKARKEDEILNDALAVLSCLIDISDKKHITLYFDKNTEIAIAEVDITYAAEAIPVNSITEPAYGVSPDIVYKPVSKYPFVARDISLFVPEGIGALAVEQTLAEHAGELLSRIMLFDKFEKDGRISYAFRLVFQSYSKTLSDEEVNGIMDAIYEMAQSKQWEVR